MGMEYLMIDTALMMFNTAMIMVLVFKK